MPDIRATLGLDSKQFSTGLANAQQETQRFAARTQQTLSGAFGDRAGRLLRVGGLGVALGAAFKVANEGAERYRKTNTEAADEMRRFGELTDVYLKAVGERWNAVQGFAAEYVAILLTGQGIAADGVTAKLAEIQAKFAALKTPEQKATEKTKADELERQAKQIDAQLRLDITRRQVDQERIQGREREADLLEAEVTYRKRLLDIENDTRMSAVQKAQARSGAQSELDNSRSGVNFRARQAREAIDADIKAGELAAARATMDDKSADIMQIQYEYAQKIEDVRRNGLITEAEKQEAILRYERQRDQMVRAREAVVDKEEAVARRLDSTGLAAGLGGGFFSAAAFGSGSASVSSPDSQDLKAIAAASKQQIKRLDEIARNTGRSSTAVLA